MIWQDINTQQKMVNHIEGESKLLKRVRLNLVSSVVSKGAKLM